jgi:hypothetical protein
MQHTHTHTAAAGLCSECFGFPVVAVATSKRAANGSRRLNRIYCGTCKGSGNAPVTPAARVVILSGAVT